MIGRETRVLLRPYLEQGMSKAVIARQVGINLRTVYRWIAAGGSQVRTEAFAALEARVSMIPPSSSSRSQLSSVRIDVGPSIRSSAPFAFIFHHHDCAEPDDEAGACVERGRRLPGRRLQPHGALSSVGRERLPYNPFRGDVIRGKKSSKLTRTARSAVLAVRP